MDKDQLLEVIENGETQEVEFKQSFHSSQDFSKLMSGFANTYGGMIIIGVGAVITLMSVGRGTQASVLSTFEELGTNLLNVVPRSPEVGGLAEG
ncbi:ABC transporter permease, partial [Candidatus Woesearchaeota archaeon]|nr:ABC transporter permease [Candidatus Woesearchaeota archaeon]